MESKDKQSQQTVQQAIKDDQGLTPDTSNIKVTVENGAVTLDGQVSSEKQLNLATNTATAVAGVETVDNNLLVKHKTDSSQWH